jgi:hypothetical protein
MRRKVRFEGLAALAAVLGIAATPAAGYSATRQHQGQYTARSPRATAEKHPRARNCKKGQVSRNGKCVKKSPAPAAPSATLIVHVYVVGGPVKEGRGPACSGTRCPSEHQPLRISRLGPSGEVMRTIETSQDTVHIAPGRYEVTAWERHGGWHSPSTQVILSEDQELEVTLKVPAK